MTMVRKIKIKMKSFDHTVLHQSAKSMVESLQKSGLKVSGVIPMPVKKSLYSVRSDNFIYKESREQFFFTVYKRVIIVEIKDKQSISEQLPRVNIPHSVEVTLEPMSMGKI